MPTFAPISPNTINSWTEINHFRSETAEACAGAGVEVEAVVEAAVPAGLPSGFGATRIAGSAAAAAKRLCSEPSSAWAGPG